MKLRDKLWLWGQNPGSHHAESDNIYNLPGENKMGPVEGAHYLNIPNMCRVVMEDKPIPPFDAEAEELKDFPKVAWSILGSGGSKRTNDGGNDLDEVLRLAKKYPNITAGIMDDFMRPDRMAVYTPDIIRGYRDRLHAAGLGLWTVIYEHEITPEAEPYLAECDLITTWTWSAKNLKDLDTNLKNLKSMLHNGQKVYAGCYMWDYGDCRPLALEQMKYQLDVYYRWLTDGEVDGIIICSNCIADLGLDTVEYTRNWINKYGDTEID